MKPFMVALPYVEKPVIKALHMNGLVQTCIISIANTLKMLQYCTQPSI